MGPLRRGRHRAEARGGGVARRRPEAGCWPSRARAPELAESFAASVGAARSYARWPDLLDDADVDGVYIATPVHLHAEQTIAAAAAGKHVLCEKPMAMTVAECDRMIAACRTHGVTLSVAYYRHFYPAIVRIKQILAAGEIGRRGARPDQRVRALQSRPERRPPLVRAGGGGGRRADVRFRLSPAGAAPQPVRHGAAGHRAPRRTSSSIARWKTRPLRACCSTTGPCATLAVTHAAMEARDTLDIFGTAGSIHVANLNAGGLRILTAGGRAARDARSCRQPACAAGRRLPGGGFEPACPGGHRRDRTDGRGAGGGDLRPPLTIHRVTLASARSPTRERQARATRRSPPPSRSRSQPIPPSDPSARRRTTCAPEGA